MYPRNLLHNAVRKYREMNKTYDFLIHLIDHFGLLAFTFVRENAQNGISGRLIVSQLFTSLLVYFQIRTKVSKKKEVSHQST